MIEAEDLNCNELFLIFHEESKAIFEAYSSCKDAVNEFRKRQKCRTKKSSRSSQQEKNGFKSDEEQQQLQHSAELSNAANMHNRSHRNFRVDALRMKKRDNVNDKGSNTGGINEDEGDFEGFVKDVNTGTPPCSRKSSFVGADLIETANINMDSLISTAGSNRLDKRRESLGSNDVVVESNTRGACGVDVLDSATPPVLEQGIENESTVTSFDTALADNPTTYTDENTLLLCIPQALSFRSKQTLDDLLTHVLVPWNEAKGAFITLGGKSVGNRCCDEYCGCCCTSSGFNSCSIENLHHYKIKGIKNFASGDAYNRRVLIKGSRIHTLSGFEVKRSVRIMFTEDLFVDVGTGNYGPKEINQHNHLKRKIRILHIDRPLQGGPDAPCTVEEMTREQVTRYLTLLKCLPENQACFQQLEVFIQKVRDLEKKRKYSCPCKGESNFHEDKCMKSVEKLLNDVEIYMRSWILSSTDALFESSAFDGLRNDPNMSSQMRRHKLQVQQALESYVTRELYDTIYNCLRILHNEKDVAVDDLLYSLAQKDCGIQLMNSLLKGFTQQNLKMRAEFQCPQDGAIIALFRLFNNTHTDIFKNTLRSCDICIGRKHTSNSCTTPLEKLLCMEQVVMEINDAVERNLRSHYLQIGSFQLTTDDLLDQIVFVLVEYKKILQHHSISLCSIIQYIRRFHLRNVNTTSLGYILANFEVAVEWIWSRHKMYSELELPLHQETEGVDMKMHLPTADKLDKALDIVSNTSNVRGGLDENQNEIHTSFGYHVDTSAGATLSQQATKPQIQQRINVFRLCKYDEYANDIDETQLLNMNIAIGGATGSSAQDSFVLNFNLVNDVTASEDIRFLESCKYRDNIQCWILTNGRMKVSNGIHHALFARKKFRKVSCGENHMLALTVNGTVYGWGNNRDGQVGVGEDVKRCSSPFGIGFGVGNRSNLIVDLICGSRHSMALSADGHLWSWGRGKCGRLGHGGVKNEHVPRLVCPEIFCKYKIIHITAGWSHSLAVTSSGRVFAWGCGGEGRLGLYSFSDVHTPTCIEGLRKHVIVKAAGGFAHTCMISSKGQVFVCGHGGYGQLGLGDSMLSDNTLAENQDYENDKGRASESAPELRIDLTKIPATSSNTRRTSGDSNDFEDLQTPRRPPLKVRKGTTQMHVTPLSILSPSSIPETDSTRSGKDKECEFDEDVFIASRGSGTMCMKPVLLSDGLEQVVAVDLDCGKYHCAVVGDLGDVYTWGRNVAGQCGAGSPTVSKPLKVRGVNINRSLTASSVICGSSDTYVCSHTCKMFGKT